MLSGMHLAVMSHYKHLFHVLCQAMPVQHIQLHISKSVILVHI
jgi:hypothetical protein